MKILVVCEESQTATIAFRKKGHLAFSCDIQECSGGYPEWHIRDDCFHELSRRMHVYDFIGAHPPCTYLANSGIRWLISDKPKNGFIWNDKINKFYNPERWEKMEYAAIFFKSLLSFIRSVGLGYVENPIIHKYALEIIGQRHTQIIHPWQFGHGEQKATCLWLVGLTPLKPTNIVSGREQKIWKMPPSADRKKLRSKTYPGIAAAMATQWV